MSRHHDPNLGTDTLATRASFLGRLKNWDDVRCWEEFTQIYSRLIRAVARRAGLSESEAQDVEQDTPLCVAKTIHDLGVTPVQVYLVYHRLTKLMKREVEYLSRSLE